MRGQQEWASELLGEVDVPNLPHAYARHCYGRRMNLYTLGSLMGQSFFTEHPDLRQLPPGHAANRVFQESPFGAALRVG